MELNPLTKEQYLGTTVTPMRCIEADDDSCGPTPIADYVDQMIKFQDLPTSRKDIDIHHVYMNDRAGFCHILLNWGEANVFAVVITKPADKTVYGHYLLNLNSEYGQDDLEES